MNSNNPAGQLPALPAVAQSSRQHISISERIRQSIAYLLLELPARGAGYDRLIRRLESSGQSLQKRMASANGRVSNQKALAQIIRVERWGRARMKAALGEQPPIKPTIFYLPNDLDWQQLQESFRAARQETISLSKTLRMAGVDPHFTILHDQFGALSLLGWLYYLDIHARFGSIWIN